MALRIHVGWWRATLMTSIGLAPLTGCGGTSTESDDAGSGGTAGQGGSPSSGGASAGGPATGGRATGGAASGGSSSGGSSGGAPPACRNPQEQVDANGRPTGFVLCEGGGQHRTERRDCASLVPRAEECLWTSRAGDAGSFPGSCRFDADCTAEPNGYCSLEGNAATCSCRYGCVRDEDCGTGQICLCGHPVGQCVSATCTVDADCPPSGPEGSMCLSYVVNPGCGGTAFACRAADAGCTSNADCASNESCALDAGRHVCQPNSCAIGRPFLVGGEVRLAPVASRGDWSSSLVPGAAELDAEARAAAGARWTEVALMEHASIAAFARFALEILALGAPPSLVEAAHRAMADETVHAKDAFALASAYLGRAVGPGPLDLRAALDSRSPLDVVRTAILEGCIGETVAAVEAAEALAHATDPAVREALARVTEDETRHAELAWRFVQWVLEHGQADLRRVAAIELVAVAERELGACVEPPPEAPRDRVLAAHGIVGEATRVTLRRRVLADVVVPCARALAATGPRRALLGQDTTSDAECA